MSFEGCVYYLMSLTYVYIVLDNELLRELQEQVIEIIELTYNDETIKYSINNYALQKLVYCFD